MKKCQPVTLTPYLDGELSDELRAEVDQHLQSCAACGTKLEQLTDATRQVSSMGRAVIPMAALTPALEIFVERAGLTPSSEMVGTTEVTRAGPTLENLVPEADMLGVGEIEPAPESPARAPSEGDGRSLQDAWSPGVPDRGAAATLGIPDDEFWRQGPARPEPVDPDGGPTSEPDAGEVQGRTWIEPEPWKTTPELDQEAAPPDTRDAEDESGVPAEPSAAAAGAIETDQETERADTSLEPAAIEPQAALPLDQQVPLEEHPSPPPPEIRPPWMNAPSGSDEDLEEAGRRAVDEAIAHDQADDPTATGSQGAPAEAGSGSLEADEVEEAHRPWLGSLFDRRHEKQRGVGGEEQGAVGGEEQRQAEAEARGGLIEAEEALAGHHEETPDARDVTAPEPEAAGIATPAFDFGPDKEPVPTPGGKELGGPWPPPREPEPVAATAGAPDDPGQVEGYRQALVGARGEIPPPARGLGSLNTQLKLGLLAALAMVVVLAAVLLLNQRSHAPSTASTSSQPSAVSHPSPVPSRSAAPSPAPSAASSGAPAGGQLTEVVTAGAGGSGWRVTRVRSGSPNPATGITRVVFDLEGAGPTASAQLGRGHDGAVYLTAPGITISPALLGGFDGRGVITGITQTDTQGLALRLATSGRPGFSIGYLSVPTRLVLDFK